MKQGLGIVAAGLLAWPAACGGSPAAPGLPEVVDERSLARELERLRGKPVVVNFWATWCRPCLAEIPALLEASRSFRAAGGVVLGVSIDAPEPGEPDDRGVRERVARVAAEKGMDYRILVYAGTQLGLKELLGFTGVVPYTAALEASGRLVDRQEGEADRERFAEVMARALGRASPRRR